MRSIPASLVAAFGGVSYGLTTSAIVQGVAVGLLVSLLFALVPLLEVRRVKPLLLLRGQDIALANVPWLARVDWLQVATAVLVTAGLVAVAAWQAGSLRAGALVSGGFAVVALVLYGAAWLLLKVTAPLARVRWFPLRHAVLGLRRPGNQTRVILLSVGLGCFFVLGVRALQQNLIDEAVIDVRQGSADLFVIDIQTDQVDGVRGVLQSWQGSGSPARVVPTLRARVTSVRGRELNLDGYADVRGRGSLGREYTVTYRAGVEENEQARRRYFLGRAAPGRQQRPRSVNRGEHPRALQHQRRRPDAVRHRRPIVRRESDQRPPRRVGGCAQRRVHVRLSSRRPRAGAAHLRGFRPRPRGRGRSRQAAVRSRLPLPEHHGDRRQGSADAAAHHRRQRRPRDLGGRRDRARQRRPDPDWRGGDDALPAHLRGGDPAHARRQHAAARHDDRPRVLGARPAGRADRRARARSA